MSKHFSGLALLLATLGSEVGSALTVVGTAVPEEAETEKAKPKAIAMAVNCMVTGCWVGLGPYFQISKSVYSKMLRYQTDECKR